MADVGEVDHEDDDDDNDDVHDAATPKEAFFLLFCSGGFTVKGDSVGRYVRKRSGTLTLSPKENIHQS